MYFGYNTNGFAHHRLEDAISVIAEHGYEGVAITIDHHALNPFDPHLFDQLHRVRDLLKTYRLKAGIETGSRFLLDSQRKHQPTLLDPDATMRDYRREFLRRSAYMAEALGIEIVSFWSGAPIDQVSTDVLMIRLAEQIRQLLEEVDNLPTVRFAFEPEPGMFIDTMQRFQELSHRVKHLRFGLTLDIGHLHCQNEPIAPTIRQWKAELWNVHIEDMRRGVHEHLMFGEGEIDFAETLKTLEEVGYSGGVFVELSRHSHMAVDVSRQALAYLRGVC